MTLHLLPAEKKIFKGLSKALQDGWVVEEEHQSFEDSQLLRSVRAHQARLHDPKLRTFVEEGKKKDSEDALAKHILSIDLFGVNDDDLAELFFVLGPSLLGKVIGIMLQQIKTDSDIEDVAALTVIRNALLTSLQSASSPSVR